MFFRNHISAFGNRLSHADNRISQIYCVVSVRCNNLERKQSDKIKIDYLAMKERQHLAGKRRLSGVRGARNQAVLNAGAFIESLDAGVPLVKHIFVRLLISKCLSELRNLQKLFGCFYC